MSDLEKAVLLIIITNIIQFIVSYFTNRSRKHDTMIDKTNTKVAVLERDLELLRKDCEDCRHKK